MRDNSKPPPETDSLPANERLARERVETYLAPVYKDPLNDARPLSIRGVCRQLGISQNTLYKYGLNQRLKAVKDYQRGELQKAGIGTNSSSENAILRLKAERNEWQRKYEELLESYIHFQHSIRLEPGIDIERVLARRLPKAVRNAPGTRKRRSGRGRPELP